LNWVGRIILPALLSGSVPYGLESYTTLVIQAMDLGLVVPAAFLAGILWLRRSLYGYLLTPVVLVKGFTMSFALAAMIISMAAAGVEIALVEMLIFPAFGLINIGMFVLVLRSVVEKTSIRASSILPEAVR
jgi:hypothetical protein